MESIKTEYDQVDGNALLGICVAILQNQEKLYGPAFSRLAKKNTVEFEAEKVGQEPPEGCEAWEWSQVQEYLGKNFENYPYGFNALIYAMGKTEATLQGSTGTSQRIGTTAVAKQMEAGQTSGVSSLAEAWKQSLNKLAFFKILPPEISYSTVDEKTIMYEVKNCPFKDSCSAFNIEKIFKSDGKHICALGRITSSDAGQKVGTGCDYYVDKFANPNCVGRIVQIL
ncbi:MAG: hypothetical protein ACUVXA_09925 [Candidatus Jordarchaeum sp.]|uniref:hypothetical protein n=1 Tax=Candidatus Jordarchaeum sp. TaxID=2823881 RepID=UPI00404B7B57